MWRVLWLVILLAATIELALWITGRQSHSPAAAQRAETGSASIQVGVATVTKGDMPVTLDGLGTVTPLATVTVKSQISGHITDIKFQEGQRVEKGDLLAVIDVRPYTIALEQAQATLAHDQALLSDARVDFARYQKLMAEDSVAKQTLDTQRYLVTQDEATVQLDKAAVDNAKLNLDYCHITAPVAGRVGLRQVDIGNYVTTGSEGIVVITQMQPITVLFTLPEDDLPAVAKRFHAGAVLPATAFDRSMTTQIATGQLATIDNEIDTTTGTVKLKAQFDNKDESLFPNQFVNIRLLVDTLTGVALVPRAAVLHGAPGDYVYVVQPDDTVAIRPVKTGPAQGERISIQSGLTPGERVVVDGTDRLRDGAKINIASTSQPAGGAQQKKSKKATTNP
ncbi:MAG TPA: MdtA/MuxA family multidrug efflux RND transporter periplasmic adaptor subunit [Dongiaceae bacterium]|nr:MdtA/MuxA family multidrug efflux RND transporter periplasmic adaptor subunit [Dongiaceae bacterium]